MIEEIWKVYKDTRYTPMGALWEISNLGNVKKNNELYKCYLSNAGYYKFAGGILLHRAIVELFIGEIPDGYDIDHIDTNKLNNRIDNLRIVTRKENMGNLFTKQKMKDNQPDRSGENNPMFGYKRTNEQKENQSKKMKEYYKTHNVWNKKIFI